MLAQILDQIIIQSLQNYVSYARKRVIKNTDWSIFKERLRGFPTSNPATPEDVDRDVSLITAAINSAFHEACPLTKKRVQKCSFTPEMLLLVKEKRRLRRQKSDAIKKVTYRRQLRCKKISILKTKNSKG